MPEVNIFSRLDRDMTPTGRRIYVGERLPKEPLCSQGTMVYASASCASRWGCEVAREPDPTNDYERRG